MTGKLQIVGTLGERSLLLPNLVNEALLANDRAKYLMTVLQTAKAHADDPAAAAASLRDERLACGVADGALDDVVEQSRRDNGTYRIPHTKQIVELLRANIEAMIAPITPDEGYRARLQALTSEPAPAEDAVPVSFVADVTSADRARGDSLHLLVMDVHHELNRLQSAIASEVLDGARVYGLAEDDRSRVRAFMEGVRRTAPLKFDHPGLGTTATRADGELLIQNDIGLTDAHVLVIRVAPGRVRLTYTDVHLRRVLFFQRMLDAPGLAWTDTQSRRDARVDSGLYHLCTGTFASDDPAAVDRFLTRLGSRLVFLIDWNRARKQLKRLAPERVCRDVLQWAADHDRGHMAFLKLGGDRLILEALRLASPVQIVPGGLLMETLDRRRAGEFLKFALKTAAEGLLAGRSSRLIQDEIRAELRYYLETIHQGLLDVAAQHATLLVELAVAVRDSLLVAAPSGDRAFLERAARRAKRWESEADELLNTLRRAARREDTRTVFALLHRADDVADALEESVFLLGLLPTEAATTELYARLQDLAGLVVEGAQEYLKAVETARVLQRSSPREEMQDFLEAVDRTCDLEHRADDAHRRAKAGILTCPGDARHWHILAEIADLVEDAADALAHSAMGLRDFVLGEIMTR